MAFIDDIADGDSDDTLGLTINENWKYNSMKGHAPASYFFV